MTRDTQKDQKNVRPEIGRSMVEILGMLAIVGILSALSIVGFQYAMQLVKENNTLDVVDKTTSGAITGLMETQFNAELREAPIDADMVVSNVDVKSDGHTIETVMGTNIVVYRPDEDELEFSLENITYSVCEKLLNRTANYTSARPAAEETEWNGVYINDSREKKAAFCRRIDAMERRPLRPGAEVNPEANMVLCYSKTGTECGLPERRDTPCSGGIAHGERVPNSCALCQNGRFVRDPDYEAPACKRCDEGTGLQIENKDGAIDGEPCKECQGGTIINKTNGSNPQADGQCCVNGLLAYSATLCPDPNTQCKVGGQTYNDGAPIGDCGKCHNGNDDVDTSKVPDCHECDRTSYTLRGITSSEKDSAGKCCVAGERKYDATQCPDPNTQCKVGTTTYNDGAPIGECGICHNGSIDVDTSKVPDCHECDRTSYTLRAITSSEKDSSGKCCVAGERKYDATQCPNPSTQCKVGGQTYNNGAVIDTCKQCSNGTIVNRTGYTVPICKVCNADGTLGNAANGTNLGGGQCCKNGSVTTDIGCGCGVAKVNGCCPGVTKGCDGVCGSGKVDVGCGCGVSKTTEGCCPGKVKGCDGVCGSGKVDVGCGCGVSKTAEGCCPGKVKGCDGVCGSGKVDVGCGCGVAKVNGCCPGVTKGCDGVCGSGKVDVGCGCGVAKRSNGRCCQAGEIEAYYAQSGNSTVCCPAGHHYQYTSWAHGYTRTVCCHDKSYWPALNASTCCPQSNLYFNTQKASDGKDRCCTKAVLDATGGTCYGGGLSAHVCPNC